MQIIRAAKVKKGIASITHTDGRTFHYPTASIKQMGQWQHRQLVSQHETPRGLPKVNAADFFSSIGIDVVPPSRPILLTEQQLLTIFRK